jgi:hypothetical protein
LIGAIPWFVFIIKLRRQRRLAFAGEIQVPNRPDKFVPFNGAHHLKRLRPNAIPFGLAERDHGGVVVALSTPFDVHLDEAGASRPRCKTFSLHVLLALRCDSVGVSVALGRHDGARQAKGHQPQLKRQNLSARLLVNRWLEQNGFGALP